jgi:hypothetical protein
MNAGCGALEKGRRCERENAPIPVTGPLAGSSSLSAAAIAQNVTAGAMMAARVGDGMVPIARAAAGPTTAAAGIGSQLIDRGFNVANSGVQGG